MKKEELSKRISDLEREIEKIKQIVEAEGLLAKHDPSIFERFPVGSYICGMEIAESKPDSDIFQIAIYDNSGTMWWISTQVIDRLISCHDWIEKYHPFLEVYRERFEDTEINCPPTAISRKAKEIGMFGNKTPIKKPWEDA